MTLDQQLRDLVATWKTEADTLDPVEPDDSDSLHADGYTDALRDCADRLNLLLGQQPKQRPTAHDLCRLRAGIVTPGIEPASRRDAAHTYLASVAAAGPWRVAWSHIVDAHLHGTRPIADQVAIREAVRSAAREGWR